MLFQENTQQIAKQLLAAPSPSKLLQENDQKFIQWKKRQMLRKLPPEICPPEPKSIEPQKIVFTGMLNTVKEKTYAYTPPNLENIVQVMMKHDKQEDFILGMKKQTQPIEQEGQVQKKSVAESSRRSQSQGGKEDRIKITPQIILKQYAPFIPNSQNPYDRHTNSKMIKSKFSHVQFNDSMRNITSLIESNKKKNQFKNSPMIQTFLQEKKDSNFITQPLNVTNVLKYTLGDKRNRETGLKKEPIANPFVKVPPKFMESINDFYKS